MKKAKHKFLLGMLLAILGVGAFSSRMVFAETTGFLLPTADGSQDDPNWQNTAGTGCNGASCYTELTEASGSECNSESDGSSSYITSNTLDATQTFRLDVSGIPDGSTVTGINITACNARQQTNSSFQTVSCLDGICQDSGIDIFPTTGYDLNAQLHSIDFIKTSSSILEIGVKSTSSRSLRISKLRGNITYTLPSKPTTIIVGGGASIIYPRPIISGLKAFNRDGIATIEFITNEPTTAQMIYGTELHYLPKYISEGAGAVTSHRIELPDIDLGTVYYYKIQAVSQHGVSAEIETQVLDFAPPVAEEIGIISVATSTMEISWTTNEPTTAKIRYGRTTNLRNSLDDRELTKNHKLVLSNLDPRAQYFFHIESSDKSGNLFVGKLRAFVTLDESNDSFILPPNDFGITKKDKDAILSWQNPIDSNFSFVVLLKKIGRQPKDYFDGQIIYNGSGKSFTARDEVGAEYAIYAVDRDGNFSQMVFINSDQFRYDAYLKGQALPEIKIIQEKLKALRFFPANISTSNWFGPITEKAVRQFQKSIGAKQNGVLTEYQYDALMGNASGSQWSFPRAEKRQGAFGDDVKGLQQFLRDFGFFPFDARPSGYFGPITRRSLLEYQKASGLYQTGIFDITTLQNVRSK